MTSTKWAWSKYYKPLIHHHPSSSIVWNQAQLILPIACNYVISLFENWQNLSLLLWFIWLCLWLLLRSKHWMFIFLFPRHKYMTYILWQLCWTLWIYLFIYWHQLEKSITIIHNNLISRNYHPLFVRYYFNMRQWAPRAKMNKTTLQILTP